MAKNRRLEIILSIINDEAKRARAEEMQGFRQVAREADRQAKLAAKSQADATRQQVDLQARAARQAVDIAARAARQQTDIAARQAAAAARERQREVERAVKEQSKAFEASTREAAKQAAEQAREARSLADAQIREANRAAAELAKVQARQAADAKRQFDRAFVSSNSLIQSGWKLQDKLREDAASKINPVVAMVGKFATAATAIGLASSAFDYFVRRFEAMRDTVRESIISTERYRDLVLELAALKDRLGDTTAETKDQILYRAQTLQGRQESVDFQSGYLNTAQSGVASKAITEAESNRLMVLGGRYQGATNLPSGTIGNFLGSLPGMLSRGGPPVTAQQSFDVFGQINNILAKGGSNTGSGIAQLLKNSSLSATGDIFRSITEQAALQSAFSVKNPEGAGVLVDQFVRATSGGLGKMRGMGVEGGEKQAEYLKKLGATDQMSAVDIGKLISADLDLQRTEQEQGGRKFNAYDYLTRHGYTDQETRMSLLQFNNSVRTGEYSTFEALANAKPDAATINSKIDKFQATDPTAQARKSALAADITDFTKSGGPPEHYQNLKVQAYERLRQQGKTYGKPGLEGLTAWETGWTSFMDGSREMIRDEVNRDIEERAKRVGIAIDKGTVGSYNAQGGIATMSQANPIYGSLAMTSEESRAQAAYDLDVKIGQAGGQATPDLAAMIAQLKRVADGMERNERAMKGERNIPMVNPRPLPGRP